MNLFEELKRRQVFRVAAGYCAASFILLQVISLLASTLEWPTWVAKWTLGLIVAGFVPALVLAWAFQRTTDGIKLDAEVDRNQVPLAPPNRKLTGITIVLLLLAVGYFVADKFIWKVEAPAGTQQTNADPTDRVTLAVLPFVDMSAEGDSEYFADGLTEELLNILAQIQQLKVAARTSSFFYKGKNVELREMGTKLGVNHILEGSVRRSGDKLRITAQLIKVEDGFHMWSETYDRTLDDIFAIQDDIAHRVTNQLRAKLIGDGEALHLEGTTQNPQAQRLFLVAQARLSHRGLDNLREARKLFLQATELDPQFARAFVGYAMATSLLVYNHRALNPLTALSEVDQALETALGIDPKSSEAYAVRGNRLAVQNLIMPTTEGRAAAQEAFDRALQLNPESTIALYWYGQLLLFENRFEESLTYFDRALAIDPLARVAYKSKAGALKALGRIDGARDWLYRGLPMFSDYDETYGELIRLESGQGRADRALFWSIKRLERLGADLGNVRQPAVLLAGLGDTAGALELVANLPDSDENATFKKVMEPLLRLDFAAALPMLEQEPATGFDFIQFRIGAFVAMQAGELEAARQDMQLVRPDFYQDPPYPFANLVDCGFGLLAAWLDQKLGHQASFEALTKASATLLDTMPESDQATWPNRALLAVLRRDKGKAMKYLRSAFEHTSGEWLFSLVPLDRYRPFEDLWGEPRFQALMDTLHQTHAQQLEWYRSGATAAEITAELAQSGVTL